MSDSNPAVDAAPAPEIITDGSTDTFNNPQEAAKAYEAALAKRDAPAEADAPAVEKQELSDEDNGAPETDPAENPDAKPEDDLPPLDPPRSWTQAEKERFQSLPRETQEYLSTREQEREREFRRGQNEIAEQRKAIETERQAAAEAKQKYEGQLPALMQELQNAQQSSFADIKNVDDVTRLASEDPFRYLQWQAHQTKLQAVNAQLEQSRTERTQQQQKQWNEYVQRENELAAEYIPDLADKTKAAALTNRAAERLTELGFKQEELAAFASGKANLSLLDHRVQRLIFSDLKLADIQKAKTAVAAKPLPNVQKPGVAKPASSVSAREQELTETFNKTGSLKAAQELYALQSTRRRAS